MNGVGRIDGYMEMNKQMQQTEPSHTKNDSATQEIQTKLQGARQELKDLSYDNSLSSEEKAKKQKEIRKEISDLNRELRQRQLELQKEQRDKMKETEKEDKKEKNKIDDDQTRTGLSNVRVKTMLSADVDMEQVEAESRVVRDVSHQIDVLDTEIMLDITRNQNVEYKEKQKAELEDIVLGTNTSKTDILGKINGDIGKLVLEEQDDRDKVGEKLKEIQKQQEEQRNRIRIIID